MRLPLLLALAAASCSSPPPESVPVGDKNTFAQAADGTYINWEEHLIDDEAAAGGVPLRGADGLKMGDLDQDGKLDIVAAHEDSGHIRVSYAEGGPDDWFRLSLAEGDEAVGVEDVAIADFNGDGWLDVIGACEKAHLIYLQNPARKEHGFRWDRVIPKLTTGRDAWIRVFFADFDGDGRPEVVAVNKGAADGGTEGPKREISWFEAPGDPLDGDAWQEHVLATVQTPINAQPVDLDGDGDLDVFGGSRGEKRLLWFENTTEGGAITFVEHRVEVDSDATGFNLDFGDLNGDGRLDVVAATAFGEFSWLEQPESPDDEWRIHEIGLMTPDTATGFVLADIDSDGDSDLMAGSYSGGARLEDGEDRTANDDLGRIAWFQNPGDPAAGWTRHDIVRRKRGMFDSFVARDMDEDGDLDFVATRGNSGDNDGLFWLEQQRSKQPVKVFWGARENDSQAMPLPGDRP